MSCTVLGEGGVKVSRHSATGAHFGEARDFWPLPAELGEATLSLQVGRSTGIWHPVMC